jgi:gamma-glutamyltranspeptidase
MAMLARGGNAMDAALAAAIACPSSSLAAMVSAATSLRSSGTVAS